ncbi:hypothetical protein PGTUg99_013930 [Puccinia graminis f. sp. tritici]|uniref:Uncharacterized protein n=1 Tax=Puccinia graminis f. sp. tritici TaxID=56615 RepID=A0A5B0RJK5_PUCGR|nr:hypothetical protein PGTUg99_013930 [Puccinia graminis f. sp. tritici]
MNMNDIIYGDDEDSSTTLPNRLDRNQSTSPIRNNCSPSEDLEEANHRDLFGSVPLDDTTMTDRPDPNPSPQDDDNVAQVCSDLQEKLELDPAHLKIALLTSKCAPEARHANSIFANAAFHQLDEAKQNGTVNHIYDKAFKEFIKTKARMFFLIPSLEAYSNNPHKNGTLARSLYYLTLDAIEKQSDDWKEEHLPPALIQETEGALGAYRNFVGVLLKYQCSHLRTLLLANILETQRISIKGAVPHRDKMIAGIYSDLPPNNEKMSRSQIEVQVAQNSAMRIRMTYARLVMVYYYAHMPSKASQWAAIDDRLRVLRTSSKTLSTSARTTCLRQRR